jgi:hypothetical protein
MTPPQTNPKIKSFIWPMAISVRRRPMSAMGRLWPVGVESGRFGTYGVPMLKAGVFDDFKGATTLLLWGDREGMEVLLASLSALRDTRGEFAIDGPEAGLTVSYAADKSEGSTLQTEGSSLRWDCSGETVELAADLVEPLLHGVGHQFLDVDGLAEQVIISRDEYPAYLR